MEASVENSVSMDAKTAVNGYIHGYIHGMSLRLAEALAAKVEEKAEELGMRVVTAVADEAGHPKLVRSMDGKDPAFRVEIYGSQTDFAAGILRVDIAVRPVRAIDYVYATIRVQN